MTDKHAEALRLTEDLPRRFKALREETIKAKFPADAAEKYEEFGGLFNYLGHAYLQYAAWCRLTAASLRRQDVPDSIVPPPDEDPADTERWRQWRVS